MNIQEVCRIRKEDLKLTYQEISDDSGVPLSTVQNFFSKFSKSPSIYTVAPICKALGISLDEAFGISEHLTPTEETLQARNDEMMSWNAMLTRKRIPLRSCGAVSISATA